MSGVFIWGWDGADWVKVLVDAGGRLQVDVVASGLPLGAATAANQVTTHGYIDGIETLLGGGLPAALVAGALGVAVSNWPADPATGGRQDVQTDVMSLIRILLNARLPSVLDTDALKVREQNWPADYPLPAAQVVDLKDVDVGNFPADYPLPAAQVATLQQVTEQGTPSVHLYGYDTANWQTLLVESDVLKNLRVKLYDGANSIDSALLSTVPKAPTLRGIVTISGMALWHGPSDVSYLCQTAGGTFDGDLADRFMPIGLMGYNGATFDRLRTYGTGILKVGRAEIDSTTVRKTVAGGVVAGAHNLYWISCSPDSPGAEFELTDAIAGGGAVVFDHFDPDKHSEVINLDPPIKFATGIWIEKFDHIHSLTFCYV